MNEERVETTTGMFVTKKKTRPATEIDCSTWIDPAGGPYTYGTFVTKKKTRPAVESGLHIPHLRLKVYFEPGVSLAVAQAETLRMVQTLYAEAPDLDLVYDPAASGLEQDSQGAPVAVLALRPNNPTADLDERYRDLFQKARDANKPQAVENDPQPKSVVKDVQLVETLKV